MCIAVAEAADTLAAPDALRSAAPAMLDRLAGSTVASEQHTHLLLCHKSHDSRTGDEMTETKTATSLVQRTLYSYAEADHLAGVARGTARRWLTGYALLIVPSATMGHPRRRVKYAAVWTQNSSRPQAFGGVEWRGPHGSIARPLAGG